MLLKYIENSLSNDEIKEVESHLKVCKECLKEVIELNRIQSVIDIAVPKKIKLFNFIKIDFKNLLSPIINNTFNSYLLESLAITRDENINYKKIIFDINNDSDKLIIIPTKNNLFWIEIKCEKIKDLKILLYKGNEDKPFYFKKVKSDIVYIKDLNPGEYFLSINSLKIRLDINV